MRLASFYIGEHIGFGAVTDDGVIGLTGRLPGRQQTLREVLEANALGEARAAIEGVEPDYPVDKIRFALPIPDPEKIYCVGQNYRAHIDEMGYEVPEYPSIFSRYPRTFVPHGGQMEMPTGSTDFDYEGEMTVVIGRPARNVSEAEALDYVAGYTIANDGSVRDWQKRGPQVAPGKNWERSGMLGPWITTADEAGNPANMTLTTRINGEVRQQGSTADLVFSAAHLVSYISSFITLAPGDMITTGSPSGVAVGFDPPKWLVPGDKVEIEINTLGTLAAEVATF
ncbi:MAG: 5-carboxymethyl-2-hydroxymuconate isomerase [Rhodospirillaceae bacterium]|nr:5-carboxymethyl-2-hydroxymuconate isomerase [Rhodospirillaceae bacterium]